MFGFIYLFIYLQKEIHFYIFHIYILYPFHNHQFYFIFNWFLLHKCVRFSKSSDFLLKRTLCFLFNIHWFLHEFKHQVGLHCNVYIYRIRSKHNVKNSFLNPTTWFTKVWFMCASLKLKSRAKCEIVH